jgi:23S rRNA pseudouridine955/2504/2580 synthase/23S rRNA pseudouridine1911/1915/1917 synthase
MEFTVKESRHGWTLLAFLKEECKESLSANKIKKAIEAKSCTINGRVEFFSSYQVMKGDRVEFNPIETSKPSKIAVPFQDDYFAVIDKPPGLVCQNEPVTAAIGPIARNWHLVHRLDKDTSGLLLLAKNEKAEVAAKALFTDRDIGKMYLAIVDGRVKEKEGTIDNYLGKKGGYEGQTLYGGVSENGLRAITRFQTLAHGKGASLLLCDIKTGRTHQIRVHFSEKGHPLLGDHQYGRKFCCSFEPSRHLLHAWKLVFIHPFTKKRIELKAQVPEDFKRALEELFSSQALEKHGL